MGWGDWLDLDGPVLTTVGKREGSWLGGRRGGEGGFGSWVCGGEELFFLIFLKLGGFSSQFRSDGLVLVQMFYQVLSVGLYEMYRNSEERSRTSTVFSAPCGWFAQLDVDGDSASLANCQLSLGRDQAAVGSRSASSFLFPLSSELFVA